MRPVTSQILIFLALVVAFSGTVDAVLAHGHSLTAGHGLGVAALMWSPACAAFVTCLICQVDFATLGWNWRPARYVAAGYWLPLLYAVPVYFAAWLFIPGALLLAPFANAQGVNWGFPDRPALVTILAGIPALATVGVIASLARALGEEIGWRGFLLPRLIRVLGYGGGCLVGGVIWAAWHYPAILLFGYGAGTAPWFEMLCFTIMVVATTYILGWLRMRSGSLWPCAMLHASHNLFIQAILDQMTAHTGTTPWITTEFGAGLAVTTSICGVIAYVKRNELPATS